LPPAMSFVVVPGITGVPCPDTIRPDDTDQLYVTLPLPLTLAVNVLDCPASVRPPRPETEIGGHVQVIICSQSGHSCTLMVLVSVLPQTPQPSSTPVVIVYVPTCALLRSH